MADSQQPSVKLPQGTINGLTLTANLPRPIESFRGIPYALPPTGERRFRPAEKVASSSTAVIDASAYGPAAPGKPLLAGGPKLEYSEDCLHANVFRHVPGDKQWKKSLPVAVYIHGGAFNRGVSSGHNTASMVAWSEEPFIAVSFNYRLGALGFLPSSLSAKEGVLNLGLRDQLVLMEWVRDNITHFGGDPDNVTLFGLSAGGHSVSILAAKRIHEYSLLTDRTSSQQLQRRSQAPFPPGDYPIRRFNITSCPALFRSSSRATIQ